MKRASLEVILHGCIMRLPYATVELATADMCRLRPLIGQTHTFKNGDRDRVLTIECDEGLADIVLDHVQAVTVVDHRRRAISEAEQQIENATARIELFKAEGRR